MYGGPGGPVAGGGAAGAGGLAGTGFNMMALMVAAITILIVGVLLLRAASVRVVHDVPARPDRRPRPNRSP